MIICVAVSLVTLAGCKSGRNEEVTVTVQTVRASVATDGTEANGASQGPIHMDAIGQIVVYTSAATNLVAADGNSALDVFTHDIDLSVTSRVSEPSGGGDTDGDSDRPHISSDGTYVVFRSAATNLVASDTNGVTDIFRKDLVTGDVVRVSVDSSDTEADGASHWAVVSDDGRFVAFSSDATNLVTGDMNGTRDVFLRDVDMGITTRLSVDSMGMESDGDSDRPSMSGDGTVIVFQSTSTDLIVGDTNGDSDIFLHDTMSGVTQRVSVATDMTESDTDSVRAVVSEDGRFVAFHSAATTLDETDMNAASDVFFHDAVPGATFRISLDALGAEGNGDSTVPAIDFGGQFLAFTSTADNLVTIDDNTVSDVFLVDRISGAISLVSIARNDTAGNGASSSAAVNDDGTRTAFLSDATDLITLDTNGAADVFIRR